MRSWRPRSGRNLLLLISAAAAGRSRLRSRGAWGTSSERRSHRGPRTPTASTSRRTARGWWTAATGRRPSRTRRRGDYAARDFKRHLKVERGWKPSSVNLALAAVDHFNRFLGLGPANVKREPLVQAAGGRAAARAAARRRGLEDQRSGDRDGCCSTPRCGFTSSSRSRGLSWKPRILGHVKPPLGCQKRLQAAGARVLIREFSNPSFLTLRQRTPGSPIANLVS